MGPARRSGKAGDGLFAVRHEFLKSAAAWHRDRTW